MMRSRTIFFWISLVVTAISKVENKPGHGYGNPNMGYNQNGMYNPAMPHVVGGIGVPSVAGVGIPSVAGVGMMTPGQYSTMYPNGQGQYLHNAASNASMLGHQQPLGLVPQMPSANMHTQVYPPGQAGVAGNVLLPYGGQNLAHGVPPNPAALQNHSVFPAAQSTSMYQGGNIYGSSVPPYGGATRF